LKFGGLLGPVLSLEVLDRFLEISLKCALVFLAASVLSVLSKRQSAEVRARIWALALLGFLAVAVFSFVPAPVRFSLVPHSVGFRLDPKIAPLESLAKDPALLLDRPGYGVQKKLKGVEVIASASRGAHLLLLIWGAGALWNLGRWMSARRRLLRKAVQSEPAAASVQAILSESIARVGLNRPVRLCQCPGLKAAWTWGLRKPAVLLPGDADRWPKPALALVLEHELAHIRRRDAWIEALARPVAALLWFHPAVWISWQRLRGERERACDDAVLDQGAKPSEYAAQLLKMAASLGRLDRKSYPELALSGRDGLKGRLAAILGPRGMRGPRRRRVGVVLAAGVIFLIGSLSSSSFWLENGRMGSSALAYWEARDAEKESDLAYIVEDALARGGWTSAYARFFQSLSKGEKIKLSRDQMFNLGARLLLETRSFEEARSVFRTAMEAAPDSARGLKGLGDRFFAAGKRTEAIACYEMMIALYPEVGEELGAVLDSLRSGKPEQILSK